MMKGWKEISIGLLCKVGRGSSPRPISDPKYFENGNIPWVKIADATASDKTIYKTKEFVNEYGASFSRFLKKGSLILATSGVSLGQTKFLGVDACIHDGWLYFDDFSEELDKNFFYYRLLLLSSYLHGQSYGAAIQNVNTGILRSVKLNLPPLPTQRKIATILSAYDDLIENNLKRIKLLEEKAQLTYEEWFVHMKFPGHETMPINKETGLPEGWEKVKVRDYVKVISKGPSLNYDGSGTKFPVLNQSCIRNGEIELDKVLYASELSKNKEECYLKINDILINSMGQGTLGRVSKNVSINQKYIIHNCITFLRAKDIYSQYMLFYYISMHQPYFESIAQGSTGQSTLKKELVSNLEIKVPKNNLLIEFDSIIEPIWKSIGFLKNQNQLLKEARDILLPRLMTGMIDVEKIKVENLLPTTA